MLQFEENLDSYLFLINFSENPEIKNFELTCDDNFGNIENRRNPNKKTRTKIDKIQIRKREHFKVNN